MRKKQADEEKHGLELTEIAAIILEKDILPSMASKPVIRDVVDMDLRALLRARWICTQTFCISIFQIGSYFSRKMTRLS